MLEQEAQNGNPPVNAQETQAGQGGGMPTGELVEASPQEQEQYDLFMSQALKLVYSEKMFPQVLEMLAGAGDPVEGLARTAAMVTARVATAGEKRGVKLMGDVVMAAGKEIVEDLAELSKRAGIKDYEQDPAALEGAYFRALDQFRMMMEQAGRIDKGAAQRDMKALEAMDQSGELEQVFRNLAQAEGRGGKQEQESSDKGQPRGGGLASAMNGKRAA